MFFNLPKQNDKGAKNGAPMFRLYIVDINDIDVENWPAAVDATITTDVLKAGKKWTYLDANVASINPNAKPGESPLNGVLTLTPFIEGLTPKALQWLYDNVGSDCIVVWERCSDHKRFIGGSPCSSGLKLSYTDIGSSEGGISGMALQFQGGECPEPFLFYEVATLEVEPDLP